MNTLQIKYHSGTIFTGMWYETVCDGRARKKWHAFNNLHKILSIFFCLAGQHDRYYKCIFCYIKSIITNATNFHRKLNGWKIVFYCLVGGRITILNVQIHFNWFAIYLPTYILATNVQPSRILYIILDEKTNPIWNGSQMVGTWLIFFSVSNNCVLN